MPITQAQAVLKGERLALTRALTEIENGSSTGNQTLEELYPHTGQAHLIGITGAPGTGKSTLVNQLALHIRQENNPDTSKVAIVAVDPTSPFSGGALLGDRVRMQDLAGDPGIFVRSMASRGSLGGLAETTAALVQVFDAAGFDIILIETVGAGQAEVEIASLAHSTIVIEAPGLGDEIQTIKAGILEIADILVVNKSDQPGADNALRALKNMLTLSQPDHNLVSHHGEIMAVDQPEDQNNGAGWMIPVLPTVSTTGEGISDLLASIQSHYQYLQTSGEWAVREKKRLSNQLDKLLAAALRERWESSIAPEAYQEIITRVTAREISPRYAVENLIKGAGL